MEKAALSKDEEAQTKKTWDRLVETVIIDKDDGITLSPRGVAKALFDLTIKTRKQEIVLGQMNSMMHDVLMKDTRGEPGRDGTDGKDGKEGLRGPRGPDGKEGREGRTGKDGCDGKDGIDGKDGKNGTCACSSKEFKAQLDALQMQVEFLRSLVAAGTGKDAPTA
ncbi:Hypothetical protein POVN_LOCUS564 [uncultured virus]|nr:Hypothetical protein POVN_LOCUS564 [uncultured virus]